MIEFIADLQGSAHDRKGNPKDVLEVAGITAEQLRFVCPLLVRPWSPSGPVGAPILTRARVANPVTYLFQKVLVSAGRQPPKDANDLLYLTDTLTCSATTSTSSPPSGGRSWPRARSGPRT